jgi:E3 ubiquitin-protein ligase RNF115/126
MEYLDSVPDPEMPVPPNPLRSRTAFSFQGFMTSQTAGNENGPPNLQSWLTNIIQRSTQAFSAMMGEGGQIGDFFLGTEEQLANLADRLMQMNQRSMGSPPTSDSYIASVKPTLYKQGMCAHEVCMICLDALSDGTEVLILPCTHAFHPHCLSPWLKMHSECPSCRHKLPSAA